MPKPGLEGAAEAHRKHGPDLMIVIGVPKKKHKQDGGEIEQEEPEVSPEESENQRVHDAAVEALRGTSRHPQEALNEFIETFGRKALDQLRMEIAQKPEAEGLAKGRLVTGPGRGMQDRVPARLGDDQPFLLSDGEFVLPAWAVSRLGDGSSAAGERVLDAMLDRLSREEIGDRKKAKGIDLKKVLPR